MAPLLSFACPHCRRKLSAATLPPPGKTLRCPACQQSFQYKAELAGNVTPAETTPPATSAPASSTATEPDPLDFSQLPASSPAKQQPVSNTPQGLDAFTDANPPLFITAKKRSVRPVPLKTSQQTNRPSARHWSLALAAGAVILVSVGTWLWWKSAAPPAAPVNALIAVQPAAPPVAVVALPAGPVTKAQLQAQPQLLDQFRPTHGAPIDARWLPAGVSCLIHLRPAQLWRDDTQSQVLLASLTDEVQNWLTAQLKQVSPLAPSEIESVTWGFRLGPTSSPIETCAVVRFVSPSPVDDLVGKYGNDVPALTNSSMKNRTRQWQSAVACVVDERTVVVAAADLLEEALRHSEVSQSEISDSLANLLEQSDVQRLLTIAADASDVRRHLRSLLPELAQPPVAALLDQGADEVEAFLWSIHPQPALHSELILRPTSAMQTAKLQQQYERLFAAWPTTLWKEVCVTTAPVEVRARTFIGRLPAMVEAARQATVSFAETRRVRFVTVLPAKAAPNLVLATLFTTLETQPGRKRIAKGPVVAPSTAKSFEERLNQLVDAEFNRVPLEQALTALCKDIQVQLVVDGDALKDAGYTRNMPQTFKLGEVPARVALGRILQPYQAKDKELVLCANPGQLNLTLTTKKFADASGLEIYPFPVK